MSQKWVLGPGGLGYAGRWADRTDRGGNKAHGWHGIVADGRAYALVDDVGGDLLPHDLVEDGGGRQVLWVFFSPRTPCMNEEEGGVR